MDSYFILVQSTFPLPTVHFLSLTDCSQTLAKVTQTLCERVKQNEIRPDSIQIDTVDYCFTSKKNRNESFNLMYIILIEVSTIPEINLAIIIGPVNSALGLHPWSTRLTEFM